MFLERTVPAHADPLYEALKHVYTPLVKDQLLRSRVTGLEHVPASGPALIVANHRTLTDPLLLAAHLPRRLHVVAAGFFGLMPVIGPVLKETGNVILPVAGGSRSAALIRETRRLLSAGRVVVVFPEGVDNFVNGTPAGSRSPFHSTFARLVLDLAIPHLPVLPVAIDGEDEFAFLRFPSQLMRMIDPGNKAWVEGTVRGTIHVGEARLAVGAPLTFDADYASEGPAREAAVKRIVAQVEGAIDRQWSAIAYRRPATPVPEGSWA